MVQRCQAKQGTGGKSSGALSAAGIKSVVHAIPIPQGGSTRDRQMRRVDDAHTARLCYLSRFVNTNLYHFRLVYPETEPDLKLDRHVMYELLRVIIIIIIIIIVDSTAVIIYRRRKKNSSQSPTWKTNGVGRARDVRGWGMCLFSMRR